MRSCLAVLIFVLLLVGSGAIASADTRIEDVLAPTQLSAHSGRLVWSRFDPTTGSFNLVMRARGMTRSPSLSGRPVPFDADVGSDKAGRPVVVYSRCAEEPKRYRYGAPLWVEARSCDLYRYDFATDRERKITSASTAGASEFLPSIWGGRIAFFRRYERRSGRRGKLPHLYVRSLVGSRFTRLPVGSLRTCRRDFKGRKRCAAFTKPTPTSLDLRGRRVAFAWEFEGLTEGPSFQIWLRDVPSRRGTLVEQGGTGLSANILRWPVIEPGRLFYAQTCAGDPTGCAGRHRYHRYEIRTKRHAEARAPSRLIGHARSGGVTFYVRRSLPFTSDPQSHGSCRDVIDVPSPTGTCTIARAGRISFKAGLRPRWRHASGAGPLTRTSQKVESGAGPSPRRFRIARKAEPAAGTH
jgi:hypothetical protein